jgi:hypothetical protein
MANSIGLVDGNVITASVPVAATAGQVLSSNGTTLAWTTPTTGTVTGLTGEVTTTGSGLLTVTLSNLAVISKTLSGLSVSSGAITSADSILTAMGKIQGQINGLAGGSTYKGTWNAATNTPTIVSSVGTGGDYYIVNTAGTTNIDGTASWDVGDWIIFDGTVWQKVDNTDSVTSVNGLTGAVNLTTTNISEATNLYYTDARARAAISLTTTGSSGASTYVSGVLNVPAYTLSGLGGVPTTTTLSINGTSFDLSANRSWSVGTVTSVNATVPTGFAVGSAVTSSGNIAITFASGYSLPTNLLQANWDTAYNLTLGAALTKTDDTNVTLTLGGTPATSLLRATSLTLGWTGQLAVGRGGTGASTLTGVVIGNAASAMTAVAGTANQLLRRDATNAFYEFFTPNYLTPTSIVGAAPIVWTSATNTISIPVATSVADGYLSAANWTTFNNKQNAISLTTTGNSGAATFISNVLNVPNYTLTGLGGVPTTRTLTINGTALDLSANRSWSVGTVTGSGTAGYIPKLTTTTNIGNSLVYDNGTQVIVNSNALQGGYTHPFQIAGNAAGGMIIRTAEGTSSIGFVNSGSADKTWDISPFGNTLSINESGVTTHTPMVFHPGGNISIGVATNNAFGKLQVAGNLHVVDSYIRTGTATATNGTVLLTSSYTNGDISTIGTNGSGGGISIGYTVRPATTGTVDAYVSSTTATASKAVFIVDATQKWLMGASSSIPVGNAVSLTKMMELYETGNLIIQNGGTYVDDGVNKLQVTGSIKVTANSTISGLSVGRGAANVATNTAVGASALITNSTGSQNTAVGNDALRLNTAGLQNSAFGYRASRANTTGNTNSAFGLDALRLNTTGSNNAAFGAQALDNNTAGDNTAIGTGALLDNTSGVGNTAIGYRAGFAGVLLSNLTGSNNIFIGADSVGESTSASNRTFIGNASTASTWLGGNLLLGSRTDDGVNRLQVSGAFKTTGVNTLSNLQGTGSRMVVADANGVLSTQTIPGGSITGTGAFGQVTYWTGASSQAGNAGFTFSPGNKLFLNNTVIAATNVARGFHVTSQLSAFANNDDLAGIDLSPVYTTSGLPTGVHAIGIRTASSFTPIQTDIRYTAFSIQPTINQGGTATGITRGVHVNPTITAVVDWRSVEWSNSLGWGLYGAGTANNYLGGNLGIAITPTSRLHISGVGSDATTNSLIVQNSTTSVGLKVADSGDVYAGDGTWFRIQGASKRYIYKTDVTDGIFSISSCSSLGTTFNMYGATHASKPKTIEIGATYAIASGTIAYNTLEFRPIITQTGTANAITRGLYVNPILSNVLSENNWRSVEWSNNGGYGLFGIGSAQNLLNGKLTVSPTVLAASFTNANTISVLASQVLNIPAGNRGTIGNVYSSVTGAHYFRFNGATTLFGDALWSGSANIANVQFDTTGTVTMANSATTGYRPLSVMQLQMQASGANNGTIDHGATLFIQGVYPSALTGIVTFTDYAAVRINDLKEWGGTSVVLTNRWGIYQAGADDKNYFAASVGIGVDSPVASAKLQVDSTTQGFLPPRMTTVQMNAIGTPAAGLIIFNTTDNKHYGYNGTTWTAFY